jgi:putative tryptophan/tyrosine transport system substrate-binding protein
MFKNKLSGLLSIGLVFLAVFGVYRFHQDAEGWEKKITIGIIMPMDHMALREIVEGFKETMAAQFPHPVAIKVQNAQGDMNLQHSIIQQFINEKVDVLVPIGSAATQMTVSMAEKQPIVSLAALYTEKEEKAHQAGHLSGVIDEIGPKKPVDFMKVVFPHLKKITLVYSNSEKVFPEVAELMNYAPQKGIQVQKLMIQTLPDLYTLAHRIDPDSEAIFVLKDHLIVSGIPTVIQEARKRNIPLITSDEGSVQEGALFALGVKEKMIGVVGAEMTIQVLQGTQLQDLPVRPVSHLSVFYNEAAAKAQKIDVSRLKQLASDNQYEGVKSGTP